MSTPSHEQPERPRHPTASRLITEGMRLFAIRGMAGTPITDIERAAGLAPGRGGFYKHFRSKAELYDAAVHDASVEMAESTTADFTTDLDLESELRAVAAIALAGLDARRDLLLVSLRELQPGTKPITDEWPARGHAYFCEWLRHKHRLGILEIRDAEATTVLLLGALRTLWLDQQGSHPPVLEVSRPQAVEAWIDLVSRFRPRS